MSFLTVISGFVSLLWMSAILSLRAFRLSVSVMSLRCPKTRDDCYSTVTDLARLRGWSTSQPRRTAMW